MSTLEKYVASSNQDLRAEAVLNTLQNKILKKTNPTEQDVLKQDLKKLKNKGYTDELKAEANMNALQKKTITRAKQDNPEFNTYQKLADRDRADLAFEIQLKTISDNATKKPSDIKSEPMSGVTQAMIEDYQAEQMQPIEIEGQFFKYHPAGADKVVLDPPPVLEPVISERDIRRAKRDLRTRAELVERTKEEISTLTQVMEQDKTQ